MTEENMQNENTNDAPLFSPSLLVGGAGLALLVGIIVLVALPGAGALGYGALGIGLLLLILTLVLAPQQAVAFLTGRNFRFSFINIFVTVLFLVFLGVIYWFITTQDVRFDITQTDEFSLNDQAQLAIEQIGADPSFPEIEVIGFYDSAQATNREQIEILLDDYVNASNDKISYRFVNPDRNPEQALLYGVTNGTLVVQRADNTDPETVEQVNTAFGFDQNVLTNAMLAVGASGDFRAYFLNVADGVAITDTSAAGISDLVGLLQNRLRWDVQEVSLIELASPESEVELNDPNADGEVLVIIGGSQELNDTEAQLIIDYLDNGGQVVMFAAPDLDALALASTESLNSYFAENFGISYNGDIVLDPSQALQTPEWPVVNSFRRNNYITQNTNRDDALVMQYTRSINVSDAPPAGVNVFDLASTSANSYAKTFADLLAEDYAQNDDDPAGPLTVLAAAENSENGARLVLSGSIGIVTNQFTGGLGIANQQVSFNTLLWATDYNNFVETIPQVNPFDFRPQDAPIQIDNNRLNTINFVSLWLLPWGVLIIGFGLRLLRQD